MTKKSLIVTTVIALSVIAFIGCGMEPQAKTPVSFSFGDNVSPMALLPDVDQDADAYTLTGDGVSGSAAGENFVVEVAAGATFNVELIPGTWDFTADVLNVDDDVIGYGESLGEAIAVGVAASIVIDTYPTAGDGTYAINLSWLPDVVSVPQIQAELVATDATVTAVTMTLDTSTTASGTLDIAGPAWYTAFTRILDNGELNAGRAEACYIAAGANTVNNLFLTVNKLEGSIEIDLNWNSSHVPLVLTPSIAEGVIDVYDAYDVDLTVTSDAVSGEIYAWYLNGAAVALDIDGSFNLLGTDYTTGVQNYLSVVVFETDGSAAGSAQWTITKSDVIIDISGDMTTAGWVGDQFYIVLYDGTATTELDRFGPFDSGPVVSFSFDNLPISDYTLLAFMDHQFAPGGLNGAYIPGGRVDGQDIGRWWGADADWENPAAATVISLPQPVGTTFDFPTAWSW